MKINKKMLVVFIIILLGSIALYFPPFFNQTKDYPSENFSIDLNEFNEHFEKPSLINLFRKVSSPFDFKFFNLYLEPIENKALNNCTYLNIETISQNFGNKTLQIETGKKNYIDKIRIDKYDFGKANVTYRIDYSVPNNFDCSLIVDFKTKVYVEMNIFDVIGNILILFVFYNGVFLLILEIKKKLKMEKENNLKNKIEYWSKHQELDKLIIILFLAIFWLSLLH